MAEATDPTAAALHARGERLTPQRLLVLETIQGGAGHLTAEAIYERARARYPYINRATIYRTLGWLKEQGLICETDFGGGHAEYEYRGAHRHHHLVCQHCGHRQELADELVAPLATALRERYGFAAHLEHLAIFGLCRECQAALDAAAREDEPGGAAP